VLTRRNIRSCPATAVILNEESDAPAGLRDGQEVQRQPIARRVAGDPALYRRAHPFRRRRLRQLDGQKFPLCEPELTPEALANMSDERLAEILNELQARGDTIRAARSCHSDDSIVLPKTGFIHLWLPRREAGRNTS